MRTSEQQGAEAVRQLLALRTRERHTALAALLESLEVYRHGLLVQSDAAVRSTLFQYRVGKVPFAGVLEVMRGLVTDEGGYLGSARRGRASAHRPARGEPASAGRRCARNGRTRRRCRAPHRPRCANLFRSAGASPAPLLECEGASMSQRRFGVLVLALVLLLGVAAGVGGAALVLRRPAPSPAESGEASARAHTTYVCPMHPTITSDHPGDCPICGMQLVPTGGAGTSTGPRTSSSTARPWIRSRPPPPRGRTRWGWTTCRSTRTRSAGRRDGPGPGHGGHRPAAPAADRPAHRAGGRGPGGRELAHRGPGGGGRDPGAPREPQVLRLHRAGLRRLRRASRCRAASRCSASTARTCSRPRRSTCSRSGPATLARRRRGAGR